MDIDTVRGKNAHDVLIQQFEQRRIDILAGTQMVVKGLDFDNVDLPEGRSDEQVTQRFVRAVNA